jgi:hypothetical protein
MKVLKHVLASSLCLLILAATASAALHPPLKMTRAEILNLLRSAPKAGDQSLTPADLRQKLFGSPAAATAAPAISTDPHYGAVPLVSGITAMGLGVGTLGDYLFLNDVINGDLLFYKNGEIKYLGTPGSYLSAGRMLGHYYFGDFAGNLFRLEDDQTITRLFDFSDFGFVVGSIGIHPTYGWVFFTINFMGPGGFALIAYDPTLDEFYDMGGLPGYCFGVGLMGNYLYLSLYYDDVIIKWNWKKGGDPLLFTEKVSSPADILLDAKGNLYVAEANVGDILKFNATATKRTKIAWGIYSPLCLGMDKRGDIFFPDGSDMIWKLRKK